MKDEGIRMTFYWIYDLPNWLLGVLIVALFVGGSVAGLLLTRPLTRRLVGATSEHNDLVNYFFAAVGVLYGLAVGLIAVGTWENFSGIDNQIAHEAAALAALYRDLDGYPPPLREQLEDKLRDYTRFIIEQDWPDHRQGEVNPEGNRALERFENEIMQFEPAKEREKIAHAEAIRSLSAVVEQRGLRLQSIGTGLPAAIWYIVLIGAALTIGLTYIFWVEPLRMHVLLVAMLATFIALLMFLTAAMDNPFRGEFSVSPDAFRTVLDEVMAPEPGPSLAP
ncbi:MAG: DUF4239 domain-containing protein [Isosphaeraceae bacterium]|nr:DUF4239 domain-containing protein [Isosphaeraceae bacterium]